MSDSRPVYSPPAILTALLCLCGSFLADAAGDSPPQQLDLEIAAPDGRSIPMRLFAPAKGCGDCTLVIFSHGAFSTYDRYDRLLLAWADAGFVVVAPLHVDSEKHPDPESYEPDAALPTRVEDYLQLRDHFTKGARRQVLDVSFSGEVIAAGHSFGALIAQIAGGANPPAISAQAVADLAAQQPRAIVAISPPPPVSGYVESEHWAQIAVPMLVVTGTADVIPQFVPDWRQHLASYQAAPDSRSYALVFDDADHYFNGAFGRLSVEGEATSDMIAQLNKSIVGFMHGVQGAVPPLELPGWQTLPDTVRALANGESVSNE